MTLATYKPEIEAIISNTEFSVDERMTKVCELLQANIAYYDWVGFYFKNGDKPELKLRAFAGEPTDHTIIPFGKGICGQVAVSNENFLVPDDSSSSNEKSTFSMYLFDSSYFL